MIRSIKYFAYIKKSEGLDVSCSSVCEKSAYDLEEIVKMALAEC